MSDPRSITKKWIKEFIIGFDICPFAAFVYENDQILYTLEEGGSVKEQLIAFLNSIHTLADSDKYTTGFLVLPNASRSFEIFLDLLDRCELILEESGMNSEFQIVGFHPNYIFDQAPVEDPANYTNRSPFPMIHILYTEDVHAASVNHPDIGSVPKRNIEFLRSKGTAFIMKYIG